MRIVFMGTPAFAVPSLQALIDSPWSVVGVYCQPDRPKGRSGKPQPCPVKRCALEHDLPIFQPERIRKRSWRQQLESLKPDLVVVAAYGQILSQKILDAPAQGCINIHASLLPRWRGAAPIHAAIAAGDQETGVGIMKMTLGLDEGPVYATRSISIEPEMGRLHLETALANLGATLLVDTIPQLAHLPLTSQDENRVTYAPIIKKAMGICEFEHQTALDIERRVRAFEDWPNMLCQFRGKSMKILAAAIPPGSHQLKPGELKVEGKKTLLVGCAAGTTLSLLQIQIAGKKAMEPHAFINGYRPQAGETLDLLPSKTARIDFP